MNNMDDDIFGGLGDLALRPEQGDLLVAQDGAITSPHWSVTSTGLEIPFDLDRQEFEQLGRVIKSIHDGAAWLVGDYAIYAERRWGFTYKETAEKFGYEPETVKQYAYVCSNFAADARLAGAHFACHRLLIGKNYSTQELRRKIAQAIDPETGRPLSVAEFEATIFGKPTRPALPKFNREPVAYVSHQTDALRDKIISRSDKLSTAERRQIADLFRLLAQQIEELEK